MKVIVWCSSYADYILLISYVLIGSTCPITFWNGQVVDVSLPLQAQWKVTETTQNGGQTLAILENGLSVSVPAFIDVGDTIIVTTEDCKYVSRV